MENWSTVSVTMMTFVNSFLAVVVIFCIGNVKSDSTEELFMNHEILKKIKSVFHWYTLYTYFLTEFYATIEFINNVTQWVSLKSMTGFTYQL